MPLNGGSRHEVYRVLFHEVRREILLEVCQHSDEGCTVDELITRLLDSQDDADRNLALQCHHTHLPKLEDLGLIVYDWEEGRVRYTGDLSPDRVHELADLED